MKPNSGAAIYEKYSGKNITMTEKTKRGDGFCKQCKNTIEHGTKYASVVYNDGFMERGFGSFHIDCWNELNKK